jgi:hypothetical protein
MSDIDILVDSSQVKTAKQELYDLENSFNSAAKSASVFMQMFARAAAVSAKDAQYLRDVARANQEIINKNLKVSDSYNSAEASASAFTEELRKQEAQAFKTARANQDAINSQLGVSGPTATSGGAGFAALEGEVLRLEAMYNRVAMAARVYEQAQQSLNRAVLMGVIADDQKEAKLAELSLAFQKVGNDADRAQAFIDRFGENAQVSGRGLNRFGMMAQQVGYQVGDFFVQIQSGTNVLVAFGQQATQLAGLIPGVWGAAIGIGISLATAIGSAFMRSGEAADEASKGIDKYKQAVDNLKSSIQSTQNEINRLSFGTEDDAVAGARQAMLDAQSEIARVTASQRKVRGQFAPTDEEKAAIDKAKKDYSDLVVYLNELTAKQKALAEAQRMLNGGLSTAAGIQKGIVYDTEVQLRLARELKEINSQVKEGLVDPQKNLAIQREYQALLQAGVKPVEAQAEAQYKVERALIQAKIASGQLTNEQNVAAQASLRILDATFAIEDQIRRSATETSLLEEGLSQSVIDALKLEGVDLTNLSDGALSAAIMASNLGISLGLAQEIEQLSRMSPEEKFIRQGVKTGALPREALNSLDGQAGYTNDANAPIEIPGVMTPNPDKPKKGGDKKDPLGDLQKQLELERELLGTSEAYQKVRQALGDDFRKTSPEVIAGLVQQATEIERLIELEEQRKSIMDTVKSSLEDGFMSMVDGTKSVKDAFKSMAAEIIKELYRVYVVQRIVGAISGAFGGGGGGGGFFSAPATGSFGLPFGGPMASGGPVDPNKVYLVGEKGPELVIPRQSGTVVNAAQTAQAMGKGSGDVTVQNNITVTGSDAAMVRAEVAKMIPQITNATKAAVIDARLRGGQMKQAFR